MRRPSNVCAVPLPPPVTLIVIAKSPRPGLVKTRLCPPCTPFEAAALAEAALIDTLAVVRETPARRRVLALDGPVGPWLPRGFDVVAQRAGGLDVRLAHAFASAPGAALLVGMDTPQLTPLLLTGAIDALLAPGVDAVLGPADDGGWWMIGLRAADPRVFVGVPMSTPETAMQQRRRLSELGLRTQELGMLRDVDSFGDARAVAAGIPASRFARALRAIEEMDMSVPCERAG